MNYVASAPAKVILFGEHAVNRGAMALAVSVGLRATCLLTLPANEFVLLGGGQTRVWTRAELLALGQAVDRARADQNFTMIQELAGEEFFSPAAYVLAGFGKTLPAGAHVTFESTIPLAAGLGSGGATSAALAATLAYALGENLAPERLAALAHRGDVVAHGGVASGLDSQTSLYGGAIRYTAERQAEPIVCAPGMMLVIGNTGVYAATSAVNGRVRHWLLEQPSRQHYFDEIGLLARHAEQALCVGDWPELGHLMNLNQLVLERIGVSSPELEALNDAALGAGALGAKLSGSGGGGIMVALVSAETQGAVAQAICQAGGEAIIAEVGVPGVEVRSQKPEARSQNGII